MRNVALLYNPVLEYRPNSSVPVNIQAVGERIASLLDGVMRSPEEAGEHPYFMPFAAVHESLAHEHGITGNGDVYGGVVKELEHADKAILHELPSAESPHPRWYSPAFARAVRNVVLPGFTAFTPGDIQKAFDVMQNQGHGVRFKDPADTGGMGQYQITNHDELNTALEKHCETIPDVGAILEANLQDHHTVTVGLVNIAGQPYSWHGRPYDVNHDGATRFGGNELTVVRGGFADLQKYTRNPEDHLAIGQAEVVLSAYDLLGTKVSRITLDAVQGFSKDGQFTSGITDPSLRPSASSAAEIRAIEEFTANPDAKVVTTRLIYDYEKKMRPEAESGRELFVAHDRMNIFVEHVRTV